MKSKIDESHWHSDIHDFETPPKVRHKLLGAFHIATRPCIVMQAVMAYRFSGITENALSCSRPLLRNAACLFADHDVEDHAVGGLHSFRADAAEVGHGFFYVVFDDSVIG